MTRIVPVPDRARSAHAVFTAEPIDPVADIEAPPPSLLRHFGADDAQITALQERPHAHVLLVDTPLADTADALVAARRKAIELASEADGVVVDLTVPRIITPPREVSLADASQWVAFDLDHLVLRSRGLESFGLPELRFDAGSPGETAMILAIATGLAHRLIAEWPQNDPVGPAAITLRDIAHGYGDPEAAGAPAEPTLEVLVGYSDDALAVTLMEPLSALFG